MHHMDADVDRAASPAQHLDVPPGGLGHDLIRRPEPADTPQNNHLQIADDTLL